MTSSPSPHSPLRASAAQANTSPASLLLPLGFAALLGALWIFTGGNWLRIALVISLFCFFVALLNTSPRIAITSMLVYTAILGGLRRYLMQDFGWQAFDPLLLIVPIIAVLFYLLLLSKKLRQETKLSRLVSVLLFIMFIEIFNPLQGGLQVGAGGALYYIAPLLWFYLGRQYGDTKFISSVYICVIVLMIFGALYGMKQVFIGFSDNELKWMSMANVSLQITATSNRPFSFFPSGQEFAILLGCATVLSWTFLLQKRIIFVLPIIVLLPALFLTGIRGSLLLTLFTCSMVWALKGKSQRIWLPRLCLALTIGLAGLVYSLGHVSTSGLSENAQATIGHQKAGILNSGDSTASSHFGLVFNGIWAGIKQPIGYGLGSTTIAAGKFGGNSIGSEADFSNMFISLGAIGGITYLCILFWSFKEAIVLWRTTRNSAYLLIIAGLCSCIGQWSNGGLYMAPLLTWLSIGVLDKQFALYNKSTVKKHQTQRARRGNAFKSQRRVTPAFLAPSSSEGQTS